MRAAELDELSRPAEQFAAFHRRNQRWACIVAHRRAGKTVACVMDLIDAALRCEKPNPRFAYVAPYYTQAKDIAWSYVKQYGAVIPGAEEVLALLELRAQAQSGDWDLVVVDCAPTAETLRLLALPGLPGKDAASKPVLGGGEFVVSFANRPEVQAFLEFYIENEKEIAEQALYVELSDEQQTMIRLAMAHVTWASHEVAEFVYAAAGTLALRSGTIQRLFRDMHAGTQHVTSAPPVFRALGRELSGLATGKKWLPLDTRTPNDRVVRRRTNDQKPPWHSGLAERWGA
mgnify:CR=1 FL=1